MSTKDCISALIAHLESQPAVYDGNRKFKRLSKKKDSQGQVVRVFADDRYAFKITGDGPYAFELELSAGAPVPAFALVSGQSSFVKKSLSGDGTNPSDDLYQASTPYQGAAGPTPAGSDDAALSTSTMGDGWYFALGGPESQLVDQDFQEGVLCGFFLVRKSYYEKEGYIQSIHVSDEFSDLPTQFEEVMEACFMSYWDVDTTRSWLLANGFETNAALEAMANAEN